MLLDCLIMGRLGFEPRTDRLKAECSTAELPTQNVSGIFQPSDYSKAFWGEMENLKRTWQHSPIS